MRRRLGWALVSAAIGVLASPAMAQNSDEAALAALAAESAPGESEALAEARRLTGEGDLLGAAATLERALLANQNANDARLYYAATLCRLGDMQGARVELAKLDRQDISASLWAETDQACGQALARPVPPSGGERRPVRGEAFMGLGWDSNVTGATRLEFDYVVAPPKQDGIALIAGGRVRGQTPAYTRTIGLYAGASAYWRRALDGPKLSYSQLEGRAGVGRDDGRIAPEIGLVVRRLGLDGAAYSSDIGIQAAFGIGRFDRLRITPAFEVVDQHFYGSLPGKLANGVKADASVSLDGQLGDEGAFRLTVGGERKDADWAFFAYDAWRLAGAAMLPIGGRGTYARAGAVWRHLDYDAMENATRRKDKRLFAEGALGIPLIRRDLFVEGALNYTRRDVRLTDEETGEALLFQLRDYHSVGAQGRLIVKF